MDTVEIPSGLVTAWTIARVVKKAALLIVLVVAIPWVLFSNLYVLIPVTPVWLWLRYWSQREPLFLELWAGQLACQPYYHG
jgi:type IV secretory pathway VirB3-like protein